VSVAQDIQAELRSAGGSRAVTGRWLRDRFGFARLTTATRKQIGTELRRHGIVTYPSLDEVGLDDMVELKLAGGSRSWRRSVGRSWRLLLGLAGAAATFTALYTFARDEFRTARPPAPLGGELNFVVSDFRVAGDDDSSRGRALALAVYDSLKSGLGRSTGGALRVAGRGPADVESIEGDSESERTDSAAQVAREHAADIVVYGDLTSTALKTTVVPEFYIAPALLQGDEELAGPHQFGAPIEVRGSIDASISTRSAVDQQVVARTHALKEAIIGFGEFADEEYAAAARHFRSASRAGGQGVTYLFLGHAELRRGNLGEARRAYQHALRSQPEYARARFGLAEVGFQEACGRSQAGVLQAIEDYHDVLRSDIQPRAFPMRVKTNLGLGKANLCLTPPRCSVAQRFFDAVIADYEAGRSKLRDETAEAWGGLGAGLELCGDSRAAARDEGIRAAATNYQRAAKLTTDPARTAYYSSLLGDALFLLGDHRAAVQAYGRAIEVAPSPEARREYRNALRRQSKQ
jgi:tetratricopeptide (TPR) repeat protein